MANAYLSAHDYIRAVTGQETQSLVGNLLHTSGAVAANATSLPVLPVTTVPLAANDPITLFDGSSSEVVYVTTATAVGAASIAVSAMQYAHGAGISCCSDGTQGSLAEAILEGSAEVERICRQPLLQATYTSEELPLLTTRAMITNTSQLLLRPRQSPIVSVSALSFVFATGNTMTVDATQAIVDSIGKLVKVSAIKAVGSGSNTLLFGSLDPTTDGFVQISYIAGFVSSQLPYIIKRAATLLISDILSDRRNPTGAAELRMGAVQYTNYLRGDTTGESANVKRARNWLKPYTQEAW